ncbi:MAG: ABC transporter ATP-binding protein [Candidatus Onthovivens sp.]|nr:ABC transporter ATP-binding protein [Candidatus Onthovivens sp.]
MNIIEIKNLKKSYKDIIAVNGISFFVEKGTLFAFLGVNGAGKSTTINIISGLLDFDEGEVTIDGLDLRKNLSQIKNKIGIVYQESKLDATLSVYANLYNKAVLYGLSNAKAKQKANELIAMFSMEDFKKRPLNKLSGGQKRRVDIARALISDPEILILDEPTTGLDPQNRKLIWKIIDSLKDKGMTIFLTTHYMNEANDANYIVIIEKGEILAKGTPLELKNTYAGDYIYVYNVSEDKIKELNKKYKEVASGYKIEVKNTSEATQLITKYPNLFQDYEVLKGNMDDVFINVTGKILGD